MAVEPCSQQRVELRPPRRHGRPAHLAAARIGSVDATGQVAAPAIDFDDAATYNAASSLTVYDVSGLSVALTFYFQKCELAGTTDGSIAWNVFATANGLPVGGTPAAPVATLVYPADGRAPMALSSKVTLPEIVAGANDNGASSVPLTNVVLNLERSTQFASAFGITDFRQTGSPAGYLTSIGFRPDGMLMGHYSNGRARRMGQVELATFGDLRCLQSAGNHAWVATPACGEPQTAAPGSASLGLLQAGALEES